MKLILVSFCLIFICEVTSKYGKKKGLEKNTFTDGVEFNKISRSALLKILSAFEENIHKNLRRKKLKPVFTAKFANNRFTRPYIYPNVYEAPKGKTHPY